MQLKLLLGKAIDWPRKRLLAARWFPLPRTFYLRQNWLFDICRFAGTRDFRLLFDVGANTGQTAIEFRGFFPKATIHSFEPVHTTFLELQNNVRRWPNIQTHQLALGRKTERRDIVLQGDSVFNSLSFAASPGSAAENQGMVERVSVTSLDEFCANRAIENIDVLKTDAQGGDLDVLIGGDAALRGGRVPFVYTEVTFRSGDIYNSPFASLDTHLTRVGFQLAGFYEQCGFGPRRSVLGFCNALYFHPEALRWRFPRSETSS